MKTKCHISSETSSAKPVKRPWRLMLGLLLLPVALFFRFGLMGYSMLAYLFAGASLFCIALHLFYARKRVTHALWTLVCIGALLVTTAELPVLVASRGEETADAPYLVVLGAGVNGTTPSLSLVNRLSAAERYLTAHPNAVAVLSGGQGPFEDISEAQAMYTWLTERGIDGARLLLEEHSTSTRENLQFSFACIRAHGGDPADGVAVVSSEYHLYRATVMAQQLGAKTIGVPGHTTLPLLRINYFLREAFAVWKLWLLGA